MERKWPVAPVSRMAVVVTVGWGGGEGPKLVKSECWGVMVGLLAFSTATVGGGTGGLGGPRDQLGGPGFSLLELASFGGRTQVTRASRYAD